MSDKLDKKNVENMLLLTPLQHAMLYAHMKAPADTLYHVQLQLRLQGDIAPQKVKETWSRLTAHYPALRTCFRWAGIDQPVQIVLKEHEPVFEYYDLAGQDEQTQSESLQQMGQDNLDRPFRLEEVPLRLLLCRTSEREAVLYLCNHHILFDGWSNGILLRAFLDGYEALTTEQPFGVQPGADFKQYIKWLQLRDKEADRSYWSEALRGYEPQSLLPAGRAAQPSARSVQEYAYRLPDELQANLTVFLRQRRLTLATMAYTVWGLLLQRYNRVEDVVFGTTVSGRAPHIRDIEQSVGLFINTLPLRVTSNGQERLLDILRRVEEKLRSRESFEQTALVDIKDYAGMGSLDTMLDTLVVVENYPLDGLRAPGRKLRIASVSVKDETDLDLILAVVTEDGLELILKYRSDRMEEVIVRQMAAHIEQIIRYIIEHPENEASALELLTAEEQQRLLHDWSGSATPYPKEKTLHEQFEFYAAVQPERPALVSGSETLSYGELNERANKLAHRLRKLGLQREQVAGVLAERSISAIVGMLAVLKAGGAYLPIDPDAPDERMDYMLEDSSASFLLGRQELLDKTVFGGAKLALDVEESYVDEAGNLEPINGSSDLAYIMYTSGSTGRPKGNLIAHYNITRVVKQTNYVDIEPQDRLLQLSNLVFDGSTFDLYGALINGAALVLIDKDKQLEMRALAEYIQQQKITMFFITTSLFNLLVDEAPECLRQVKKVVIGGEKASYAHICKAYRLIGPGKIVNGYGPTESTVFAAVHTVNHIDEQLGSIPIGRPLNNTKLYVLGLYDQPQPVGIPGELCIAGDGLGRGYLNQLELTEQKFVPNPWVPGGRLYRTGDLVRWLPSGEIDYIGRIDHQVKIRGFRIEPGEVRHALLLHPSLREAAVVPYQDAGGHAYLAAYVVPHQECDPEEVRHFAARHLPQYMVPRVIIPLAELPLTPNGKADLKALPVPSLASDAGGKAAALPTTAVEKKLAELWSAILGIEQIGKEEHFFEAGGHSLKAALLIARIQKAFGVRLPIRLVFEEPTLAALARAIECELGGLTEDEQQERELNGGGELLSPAAARPYYPVTPAQKRLYFIDQMNGPSIHYNIPFMLHIDGPLEMNRLQAALEAVVQEHEALRTVFEIQEGVLVQRIMPAMELGLQVRDITEAELPSVLEQMAGPFDLHRGPLLRTVLLRLAPQRHCLWIEMHHIITDGTSVNLLVKELVERYAGREPEPAALQYKDYAVWLQNRADGEEMRRQQKHWLDAIGTDIPVLELPTDYPRPPVQSFEGGRIGAVLGSEQTQRLRRMCSEHNVTLYMALLACYKLLLAKYSGQEDIIVGSPIAGRHHRDVEQMLGLFVNTYAIRSRLPGNSQFSTWLQELKTAVLHAYDNQDYPLELLVEQLGLQRDLSRNPLFSTLFSLQNMELTSRYELSGTVMRLEEHVLPIAKFDLLLAAVEQGDELRFELEYSTALFSRSTMERLVRHYIHIIEQVLQQPDRTLDEVVLATDEERSLLLNEFNQTATDYPRDKTLYALFEEQAMLRPEQTAVAWRNQTITYGELTVQAERLATAWRAEGLMPGSVVALLLDRSPRMIAALLSVLKAGCAYVPIDPKYPAGRIEYMLSDSGAAMLLTERETLAQAGGKYSVRTMLIEPWLQGDVGEGTEGQLSVGRREASAAAEVLSSDEQPRTGADPCYVIYTSGSTGQPKGTLALHSNVSRVVKETNYIELTENDRILQLSNYAFDGSTFDIYGALLNGATLVLADQEEVLDLTQLADKIIRERISVFFITTALFNALVDEYPDCLRHVRKVLFGGEKVSVQHVRKALAITGPGKLIHVYGPTETTVFATYHEVNELGEADATVPIGRPISNTAVYVLDHSGQPQPFGVPGELCISGDGLALGYLGRPEATEAAFAAHPFRPGERLYHTGDLVKQLEDGSIVYLSRIDNQQKIRGHRIEPGEIAHVLMKHEEVKTAYVMAREDEGGQGYLCAYVVGQDGSRLDTSKLRRDLSQQLPDYMIPARWVRLEQLPLTANGKVDWRQLPRPLDSDSGRMHQAPGTATERKLAELWEEVLGVQQIGCEDHFFERGGHSIRAAQLIAKVYQTWGISLPMREVFSHPTLQEMAGSIEQVQSSATASMAPIGKAPAQPYYPATSAQRRLYIITQRDEAALAYNMPVVLQIDGELDEERLADALQQLVQRHDALRMSFHIRQGELAVRVESSCAVTLESCGGNSGSIRETARGFVRPFDLAQAPLLRAGVARHNTVTYLLLDVHHIAADGISLNLLLRELAALYTGEDLARPVIQYADYAIWQHQQEEQGALLEQEAYWLSHLAGELPTVKLPVDGARSGQPSYEGGRKRYTLDGEMLDQLRKLADQHQVTMFMLLWAVYQVWLFKHTSQQDIIVGTPISGRSRPDIQDTCGMFVNTLAIRCRLEASQPFERFLAQTKSELLNAYEHQDYPYDRLLEKLDGAYEPGEQSLFSTLFAMQNLELDQQLQLGGATASALPTMLDIAKFELSFICWEQDGELQVELEYRQQLYKEQTIDRMFSRYAELLRQITASPDCPIQELEWMGEIEKAELEQFGAGAAMRYQTCSLHGLFEEQAKRTPEQPAVVLGSSALTYRELNEWANRLARKLRRQGAGPNTVVGILLNRSLAMAAAVMGVLKSGAAYMPIDPAYPKERTLYMMRHSRMELLISESALIDGIEYDGNWMDAERDDRMEDSSNLPLLNRADDLAYVIYTSGTTGNPKGVAVPHRGVSHAIQWRKAEYGLDTADHALQLFSFAFDGFVTSFFTPLLAGSAVSFLPEEEAKDPIAIRNRIASVGITHMIAVPSLFMALLDCSRPEDLKSLQVVTLAGERLTAALLEQAGQLCPHTEFANEYGPTENSVVTTIARQQRADAAITIGRPIANCRVYVLDEWNGQQPAGVAGELAVSGPGLATGYLYQPELTEAQFVPNPYATGDIMYKTGDLVRWLPDGTLEYIGRLDDQVKIRGYRIELQEIEARLLQHPAIVESVVLARDHEGESALFAYVATQQELTYDEIKQHLASALPHYMLPSFIIQLAKLPLTTNGKVDRRALPGAEAAMRQAEYRPPFTSTQLKLAQMWQEVLKGGEYGLLDHFFERGGDSLKAMMLVSRIHRELEADIRLRDIFRYPLLEAMAAAIDSATERTEYASLRPAPSMERYPVSSAQHRLFVLAELDQGNLSYNMPVMLRVAGPLDRQRLQEALQRVAARHEAFRTSFEMVDGELFQRISDSLELDVQEIQPVVEPAAALHAFIQPFSLVEAPLLRAGLMRVTDAEHYLLLDMHHIIFDGASMRLFLRELLDAYQGVALAELTWTYKDYAYWQQRWLQSEEMRRQESYWLGALAGELPVLELLSDYPRPAIRQYEGGRIRVRVPEATVDKLGELAERLGVSVFMVLFAAYNALLARYTGQEDMIVGMPVTDRSHPELESTIGMYVHTLAIRSFPVLDDSFVSFVQETSGRLLEAYEHQNYPFERLIEQLNARRDPSRNPLFDTMFTLQQDGGDTLATAGAVRLEVCDYGAAVSKLDLSIGVELSPDGIHIEWEYAAALFNETTIERMAEHYLHLLHSAVSTPEQPLRSLPMIGGAESKQLETFNETAMPYPQGRTVLALYEEAARQHPDQRAILCADRIWTYAELERTANRWARALRHCGAGKGTIVGITAKPSAEMVIGLLAILKAGAAFMPIDPGYPVERIAYMLGDSGAGLLLHDRSASLPEDGEARLIGMDDPLLSEASDEALEESAGWDDLAYIIYTSGSTGRPKGVMVEHRALMNLSCWHRRRFGITSADTGSKYAGFGFDASVWEIFPYLIAGAALSIVPEELRLDLPGLNEHFHKHQVTVAFLPTQICEQFIKLDNQSLRVLLTGGDKLVHVRQTRYELVNNYGPTENAVVAASGTIVPSEVNVPIGRPIDNVSLYILDKEDRLQPIGVPGELCIAGDSLARGYWRQPELTAQAFRVHPHRPGERIYRTGDLARWLPGGELEFLGRIDQQVKIRGYRIELGEITQQLLEHPAVKEAVTAVKQDEQGQPYLAAYLVLQQSWEKEELRAFLGRRLPEYMVPMAYVELEAIPVTPNGKVDVRGLPEPERGGGQQYKAPSTEQEQLLVAIWEEALGIAPISVTANFFELGGDSIKAVQIGSRLRTHQLKLEMKQLFRYPTIEGLARCLEQDDVRIDQRMVEGETGLAPIQRWFFEQQDQVAPAHHWNQAVMLFNKRGFEARLLERVMTALTAHHDALRMIYREQDGRIIQYNRNADEPCFTLRAWDFTDTANPEQLISQEAANLHASLHLFDGPLLALGLFKTGEGDHVLLVAHHLIIDGVSWRILLEDLEAGYRQAEAGEPIKLQPKTHSYQEWTAALEAYASSRKLRRELVYWAKVERTPVPPLLPAGAYTEANENRWSDHQIHQLSLSPDATDKLLHAAHHVLQADMTEFLLAALALALAEWSGRSSFAIHLEGHGRERLGKELNVTRTVGWFTSMYPVIVEVQRHAQPGSVIESVKELLRTVPSKGAGYGVLKYITSQEQREGLAFQLNPEISFNYLGQFGEGGRTGLFEASPLATGSPFAADSRRTHLLDVTAVLSGSRLSLTVVSGKRYFASEAIGQLMEHFMKSIEELTQCSAMLDGAVQEDGSASGEAARAAKRLSPDDLELIKQLLQQ